MIANSQAGEVPGGFDFDEEDLLDVLVVHAFEDEEVDWLADEARFGGLQIFREIPMLR